MPSKWFVPKDEDDMRHETIAGQFPCQDPHCDQTNESAEHFLAADQLAWVCGNGHGNSVKASKYL